MKGFVIAVVVAILLVLGGVWLAGGSGNQMEKVVGVWKIQSEKDRAFGSSLMIITPAAVNQEKVTFAVKGPIVQVMREGQRTPFMRLSVDNKDVMTCRTEMLGTVPVELKYTRVPEAERTALMKARAAFEDAEDTVVEGAKATAKEAAKDVKEVKDAAAKAAGQAADKVEAVAKNVKDTAAKTAANAKDATIKTAAGAKGAAAKTAANAKDATVKAAADAKDAAAKAVDKTAK